VETDITDDPQQIRLEIPSAAEYVGVVRRAVEGIANRMSFPAGDVDDLKLAVGEACTNAIKHGCPSRQRPFITVICRVTPGTLEIEVKNNLSANQPCPSLVDAPDTSKEGGMGLYIMQKLMDEVDIVWKDRTASIRMVKHIRQD
jgi:serine/threonine-protein kinase RsbW